MNMTLCERCSRKLPAGQALLLRGSGAGMARLCLLCALRDPDLVKCSLRVSLVVGTILNLGNQGMRFLDPATVDVGKALFTYVVPYAVATYGALANARE